MSDLNHIFFEEFKKLDKLCGELYEAQYGVTHYIDDMKAASWNNYRHILNWKTDLKELIRLRHIRNHLAHAEGAFQENICTQNDIDINRARCSHNSYLLFDFKCNVIVVSVLPRKIKQN